MYKVFETDGGKPIIKRDGLRGFQTNDSDESTAPDGRLPAAEAILLGLRMGDCEKSKRSNKKTKEEEDYKHSLFRQYMVPKMLLSVQKMGKEENISKRTEVT